MIRYARGQWENSAAAMEILLLDITQSTSNYTPINAYTLERRSSKQKNHILPSAWSPLFGAEAQIVRGRETLRRFPF